MIHKELREVPTDITCAILGRQLLFEEGVNFTCIFTVYVSFLEPGEFVFGTEILLNKL